MIISLDNFKLKAVDCRTEFIIKKVNTDFNNTLFIFCIDSLIALLQVFIYLSIEKKSSCSDTLTENQCVPKTREHSPIFFASPR